MNEHPRIVGPRKYRYHSPVISAEWCAFTNFPWGRGLVNFLPEEETRALEAYRTWVHLFELLPYYSWIIDRFHISTKLYQNQAHSRDYDFYWLEEKLARLNFRVLLCTRSQDSFESARRARLKVSGNPDQYDDLSVFIREQDHYRKLIRESILPHYEVDVSDNDVPTAVERIADWLTGNGGLYMPDGL